MRISKLIVGFSVLGLVACGGGDGASDGSSKRVKKEIRKDIAVRLDASRDKIDADKAAIIKRYQDNILLEKANLEKMAPYAATYTDTSIVKEGAETVLKGTANYTNPYSESVATVRPAMHVQYKGHTARFEMKAPGRLGIPKSGETHSHPLKYRLRNRSFHNDETGAYLDASIELPMNVDQYKITFRPEVVNTRNIAGEITTYDFSIPDAQRASIVRTATDLHNCDVVRRKLDKAIRFYTRNPENDYDSELGSIPEAGCMPAE